MLLEIKGASGCQVMHYGNTEWVLSIESMLLALKVPQTHKSYTDTTVEPQKQLDTNHFSLVAYHRVKTESKLHLIVCIQGVIMHLQIHKF